MRKKITESQISDQEIRKFIREAQTEVVFVGGRAGQLGAYGVFIYTDGSQEKAKQLLQIIKDAIT